MTDIKQVLRSNARLPLLTAMAVAAGLTAMPAGATDYVVTTTADTIDSEDGAISLREAVTAATGNVASGDAPAGEVTLDTITVGATTYALTRGELLVSGATTITGGGTIDAGSQSRIFSLTGSAGEVITLDGLTLTGGLTSVESGGGVIKEAAETRGLTDVTNGGAIIVNQGATAVLANMVISNNVSTGAAAGEGGGAIFNAGTLTISDSVIAANGVSGSAGNGGGILNSIGATLTVTDTTINNNTANRAGGGIENNGGTVSLTNTTLADNTVGSAPGNGGGMHQGGMGASVTITGGSITGNTAGREGAGLWAAADSSIDGTSITNNIALGLAANQGGAGLFNQGGDMTVANATITGNLAINDDDGTGSASGGGILNNTPAGAAAPATLTVSDTTISNNKANRAGGGIEDNGGVVTLTNVTMDGNEAGTDFARPGNGGAVHVGGGEITVNGGSFTNNIAAREGGGLWTTTATITGAVITGNEGQGPEANRGGGGLFNQGGTMTVVDSTIDNNMATGASGSGGGIINNGGTLSITGGTVTGNTANRAGGALEDIASGGTVTITNVTMNNNTAGPEGSAAPGNGGAIHITGAGDMTITGSMFSGNVAAKEGGALWNFAGGTMTVEGSTIDGNMAMGNDANTGGGGLFNSGGTMIVRGTAASTETMAVKTIISNNVANGTSGSGGGILNKGGTLTVEDTDLIGNTSNRAGGAIEDDATVTATTTTLTRVTMDGNSTGSNPGNGGGFHVTGAGIVTVDQSTVSNNTASNEGGGLWNHATSGMTVINSTISANTAPEGAGIYNQNDSRSDLLVSNATIASNNGDGIATGITEVTTDARIRLLNTIVADNTTDLAANVEAQFSLIEAPGTATVTGSDNITGVDPQLGPLANNGGTTLTHVASTGPAVDGGSNSICADDSFGIDQRGELRPNPGSNFCDIGATEFAAMPALAAVANNPENRDVVDGDQNVPAVGFDLTSTDEDITVTGVSGVISGSGDRSLISNGELLRDGVPVAGTFTLTEATGTFSIVLDSGEVVTADDAAAFSITLDFGSPAAGLALLALPLFGLLLLRRSRLAAVVLAAGSLTFIACGDVEDNANDFQVTVERVEATGNTTGGAAVATGLPVTGARLTVK